jgi:Phosphotransferase enzyme family
LGEIQRACDVLRTRDGARFVPGEITEDEGLVLFAAAREHAQEIEYTGNLKVISLETKFLHGGFSGAKIAVVQVNQEGKHVVAKIDQKDHLLQEMKKFRRFIQKWDDKLQPRPFLHGPAGVILFSLVPDETNPAEPAPMLEKRLKNLWDEEIFGPSNHQELDFKADNLKIGLRNIARAIGQLNMQEPITNEFLCWSNPDMKYFRELEKRHIAWNFCSQAIRARCLSKNRFSRLKECAVVHGDIHLGNILVRGDQDMHLIDYASSGPGHPAIDLVRLELALYLSCFKQLEDDSRYEVLQRRLSVDLADGTDIESSFERSLLPIVNKVCIGGCITAGDQALAAVKAHGGDHKDYLAAKYLVAWQNLLMPGSQISLTRSIINALAPEIASW